MEKLQLPVYLDNHATTKVDPRVVHAMLPYFSEQFGNAASRQHEFGWQAEAGVEQARKQLAHLIGAKEEEIVFTSGATESINLALKGVAEAAASRGNHIITAATEHKAVLDTCKRLEKFGFRITILGVDGEGFVSPDDLKNAITPQTILVSIMMANNEIGTIAPIAELGTICAEYNIPLHTDATQAAGRIAIDVEAMHISLLSFSAHKMYGPKGMGALYIRKDPKLKVALQMDGGGHERGYRSGTLNVPGIVGFGMAAKIAAEEMEDESQCTATLRDTLAGTLLHQVDDVAVNGPKTHRLPNNANILFRGARSEKVMMAMKDIAVSTGSACSSNQPAPSHVLQAIGLSKEEAASSIRFGLGRFTTNQEIEFAIERVVETVRLVREKNIEFHLTH